MAKTFIWTIGSFRLKAVKQLRIIQNYKIHFCLYIEKEEITRFPPFLLMNGFVILAYHATNSICVAVFYHSSFTL